jgi:hypothetical protein
MFTIFWSVFLRENSLILNKTFQTLTFSNIKDKESEFGFLGKLKNLKSLVFSVFMLFFDNKKKCAYNEKILET